MERRDIHILKVFVSLPKCIAEEVFALMMTTSNDLARSLAHLYLICLPSGPDSPTKLWYRTTGVYTNRQASFLHDNVCYFPEEVIKLIDRARVKTLEIMVSFKY